MTCSWGGEGVCLFLASGSLGFLFTKATQKYSARGAGWNGSFGYGVLGWDFSGRRLRVWAPSVPPLQPPLKWSQGGFFLARWVAQALPGGGRQAGGRSRAVTWVCAKSAAFMPSWGRKAWQQTGLLSLRRHPLWAGGQRRLLNYRLRRPTPTNSSSTPPSASPFPGRICNPQDSDVPGGLGETGLQTNKEPSYESWHKDL